MFSRGIYLELVLSKQQLTESMFAICKNNEEKEVTKYLIDKYGLIGNNGFNLRTHNKCLKIYEASKSDKLNWKSQIDLFIKTDMTEGRKMLYRYAGEGKVKRVDFVKYLMSQGFSYATSERRIQDWLYLEEIHSDKKIRQSLLSINQFN